MGRLTISRPYFYDERKRQGISPIDEQLGLVGGYSNAVRRMLTRLAMLLPYEKASVIANEYAGIEVSDSSIWEIVQAAAHNTHRAMNPVTSQKTSSSERMGIAADGCLANIRTEGWKEVKLGVVFRVKDVEDPDLADVTNHVKCVDQSHVLHLGGPEGLSNQLYAEACARRFGNAVQQVVIGDGADWIWNIARSDYPRAAQVNDWYHACQHLHDAGGIIFAGQTAELAPWLAHQKSVLYGGGADLVAMGIRAHAGRAIRFDTQRSTALETQAAYFASRFDRMQYAEFREAGLPIGSGVVEAAAKQTKQRMSGTGMRWSRSGASNLLPFLAAELSGTFDRYWAKVCP